jgi:hypothetical protein
LVFGLIASLIAGLLFFADLPHTTNYNLNSYGFGSGGGTSGTSNYSLEGISGELSAQTASTSNYTVKPGFVETQQANVPSITLSNPSIYYDKLKLVLSPDSHDPTDALYAVQISTTSNFSSNINYVKADMTIGASLVLADYKTYASWGSTSGSTIIGLSSSTTYYVRAKATQTTYPNSTTIAGKYLESQYGPSSTATTVGQQISFCLYTNANCAADGINVNFANVVANTVTDGDKSVKVDFATNANAGGGIYTYSANGGLKSASAGNYLVALGSTQVDLSGASEGFGARISSVSQSSGGAFNKVSPYDSSNATTVGKIDTTTSEIFHSLNPLVGGSGTILLKILTSNTTPQATDYADTLTFIAAAAF